MFSGKKRVRVNKLYNFLNEIYIYEFGLFGNVIKIILIPLLLLFVINFVFFWFLIPKSSAYWNAEWENIIEATFIALPAFYLINLKSTINQSHIDRDKIGSQLSSFGAIILILFFIV